MDSISWKAVGAFIAVVLLIIALSIGIALFVYSQFALWYGS